MDGEGTVNVLMRSYVSIICHELQSQLDLFIDIKQTNDCKPAHVSTREDFAAN